MYKPDVREAYQWAYQDARRARVGMADFGVKHVHLTPEIEAAAIRSLEDREETRSPNYATLLKEIPADQRRGVFTKPFVKRAIKARNLRVYGDGFSRFARRWSWEFQVLGGNADDYLEYQRRVAYGF